jgi:hypothetical protein
MTSDNHSGLNSALGPPPLLLLPLLPLLPLPLLPLLLLPLLLLLPPQNLLLALIKTFKPITVLMF